MKKGTRVRHYKQTQYIGVIKESFDAVVGGKSVELFSVKWNDESAGIPLRWGDEGSHGKKGYMANELEKI